MWPPPHKRHAPMPHAAPPPLTPAPGESRCCRRSAARRLQPCNAAAHVAPSCQRQGSRAPRLCRACSSATDNAVSSPRHVLVRGYARRKRRTECRCSRRTGEIGRRWQQNRRHSHAPPACPSRSIARHARGKVLAQMPPAGAKSTRRHPAPFSGDHACLRRQRMRRAGQARR